MISIVKATENDYAPIVQIGRIAVEEAHRDSCSSADLNEYMQKHYSDSAIQEELRNPKNIYHVLYYNNQAIGFSKIILDVEHAHITAKNVTKLDRIYLLKEYFNMKLGYELLQFNIDYSKQHHQSGIWLFTWVGNERAVRFYLKTGFIVVGSHMFKVSETHSNENHHMFLEY